MPCSLPASFCPGLFPWPLFSSCPFLLPSPRQPGELVDRLRGPPGIEEPRLEPELRDRLRLSPRAPAQLGLDEGARLGQLAAQLLDREALTLSFGGGQHSRGSCFARALAGPL